MHMQPMPGKVRLGRYEMYELLGAGGMSEVYAGLHLGLRKRVALKVLRAGLRDDPVAVERFLREGECAARVSHPNVVDVDDVGLEAGVPYLAMELLTGETLEERLKRKGALSIHVALDLLLPLVDAVASIHVAGVIHRDIKPSNVVLAFGSDGQICPKLVDFGVATVFERRSITGALGPIGTPQYMSPEQAHGTRPLDPASDQYSLGIMLFEMLTGSAPFQHEHVRGLLRTVARGDFPRLSERLADLPAGFEQVVARATSRDPLARYPDVAELGRALLPFASEATRHRVALRARNRVPVPRDTPAPVLPMPSRAHRIPAAAARSRWELAMLLVGSIAMSLGLAAGAAQSSAAGAAQSSAAGPAQSADTVAPDQPLVVGATRASVPAQARGPRTLRLLPAHAEALVDGQTLGLGSVQLPAFADDALHELRVQAEGHVTRVVLFRGDVGQERIALARLE